MRSLLARLKPGAGKAGGPVIEYLPDADEIERSLPPRIAQITVWLVVGGLLSMIAWSSLARIDQVVSATGRLVNPVPNVVVQPLETSIVQGVAVRPGQTVRKGDVLATLDPTFVEADETQLRTRLHSLEAQIESLQQELRGGGSERPIAIESKDRLLQAELQSERRANYRAQQSRLGEAVARLRATLATNRQDQQLIASRLKSLREIEAMQEKGVAQKFGAQLQLLEAQQRTKEVARELELANSRELELRRELAAAEAEKQAFERGWRQKTMEDLLGITRERDALREQLEKASRRQRLVKLVAPVDAVVLEIAKLSPGSIVREAETFFTLVPLDVELEAEAQIDSADVGYVKAGDEVRLKIDAFPFQRHGLLRAKVKGISQDAYRRDASTPGGISQAYYLARIAIDGSRLENMKPEARMLPGMTLHAEVVVGDRSVISYLVWPLTKGLHEAIREP